MSATIVQSGEYDLLIDTGFDYESFVLDSATRGILDEDILGPSSSFASVINGATTAVFQSGEKPAKTPRNPAPAPAPATAPAAPAASKEKSD
jgi:hypothetical protein